MPVTTLHGGLRQQRLRAAYPFALAAVLALLGGGVLSAAMAHAPSRTAMWAVAYLVLVVAVVQAVLGVGQAWLLRQPPAARLCTLQWLVFNLGNAGVITGTVLAAWPLVLGGTLMFVLALVLFLLATRAARGRAAFAYRVLVLAMAASAGVGLLLSLLRGAS
jgi:hypothetical protein